MASSDILCDSLSGGSWAAGSPQYTAKTAFIQTENKLSYLGVPGGIYMVAGGFALNAYAENMPRPPANLGKLTPGDIDFYFNSKVEFDGIRNFYNKKLQCNIMQTKNAYVVDLANGTKLNLIKKIQPFADHLGSFDFICCSAGFVFNGQYDDLFYHKGFFSAVEHQYIGIQNLNDDINLFFARTQKYNNKGFRHSLGDCEYAINHFSSKVTPSQVAYYSSSAAHHTGTIHQLLPSTLPPPVAPEICEPIAAVEPPTPPPNPFCLSCARSAIWRNAALICPSCWAIFG